MVAILILVTFKATQAINYSTKGLNFFKNIVTTLVIHAYILYI